MSAICLAASRHLSRYRLWQKIALAQLMFILAVSPLLIDYCLVVFDGIHFAEQEREGLRMTQQLLPLAVANERQRLGGAGPAVAELQSVVRVQQQTQAGLQTRELWQALEPQLKAGGDFAPALQALLAKVSDASNLTLDPELDSYYLMDSLLWKLPVLLQQLGLALSQQGEPALLARHDAVQMLDALQGNFEGLSQRKPGLAPLLKPGLAQLSRARAVLQQPGSDAPTGQALLPGFSALALTLGEELDRELSARRSTAWWRWLMMSSFALLTFATAGWLLLIISKSLSANLQIVQRSAQRMAQGELQQEIRFAGQDEGAQILKALEQMRQVMIERRQREQAQLADEKRVAAENLRIRMALDGVAGGVMIADASHQIIYANRAVLQLLREAQEEIRGKLPGFDVAQLQGSSLQPFYSHTAHAHLELGQLQSPLRTQIELGRHIFALAVSPILDEAGVRLGTAAEWLDRSEEVSAEREVGTIVQAAARGDFQQRISLEGKSGFFALLAAGLNQLLDTSERGLDETARVLAALAQGDLTQRVQGDFQGIFAKLQQDANLSCGQLMEMVAKIQQSTYSIDVAAREIASGNLDLSNRTEQQAASLEKTAASVEELTSTVRQNAENAQHAQQLAGDAAQVAVKGGAVVGQVVQTMHAIEGSSHKIADIIGVIDGIAFQTNILALNAAVEAARAGEQGRGFAVVASEVRSLAQRSASAAKEIKQLIQESVNKVDAGSRLVREAGTTMATVVASIRSVAELMSEISAASQEQSQGIEQVNQAVTQMDQATQQNAALVEQATAAARALEQQAAELRQGVARFQLLQEAAESKPKLSRSAALV